MDKFAVAAALVLATASVALGGPGKVPANVKAYEAARAKRGQEAYPAHVVRIYNLQRVLDPRLSVDERTESLKVVNLLGPGQVDARSQLAALLAEPKIPGSLQRALLEYLLKADHAGVGTHVLKILPRLRPGDKLRETILRWLLRHPTRDVLIQLVKIWAQEPVAGPDEPQFRAVVERMTGMLWDEALLNGINTPQFYARGSAMEVLAARTDAASLREKIAATESKTAAMAAVKTFMQDYGYLPRNGAELLATVLLYKNQKDSLPEMGRMAARWSEQSGYAFNIRDFHLLTRLGKDPIRKQLSRKELFLAVAKEALRRGHVKAEAVSQAVGRTDDLSRQMDNLSLPDLWNIYLLHEMLSHRRVQLALRVMAARDGADRTSAWGGLVSYQQGRAQALLYPAAKGTPPDDQKYVPSRRMLTDSRDALCRFHARFQRVHNARHAGPTPEDLGDAKLNNYYGLVLTSYSRDEFCAHYHTPTGMIVSLGKFPFLKR